MKRTAIIGAGISGLAHAEVLRRLGFSVVLFERGDRVGGVWAKAYPEVTLQNTWRHYQISSQPWPTEPDLHPTGAQIMAYLEGIAAGHDVRLQSDVERVRPSADGGWDITVNGRAEHFDHVVVSVGQYTEGKHRLELEGDFEGQVLTERDVKDLSVFDGKRVVVVGFGKSALDMATFAVGRAKRVHHVFRTPRWALPREIFGVHYTAVLFNRFGSVMMPAWTHPTAFERFLHRRRSVVGGFWSGLESVFRHLAERHAKTHEERTRVATVMPSHRLVPDLRSAAALAPPSYYPNIAKGTIEPHRAEVDALVRDGVRLSNKTTLDADVVVLSVGSKTPAFPFLDDETRALLESEEDGVQLYRHVLHPQRPNLAFAGFNHGFMHVPSAEVGALWLGALWQGKMKLPSVEKMEADIEHVRAWKREHVHFEPSRSCATTTRFQQYLDIMLADLGLSPYRKMPNVFAEVFGQYGASDYAGIVDEFLAKGDGHRCAPSDLPT